MSLANRLYYYAAGEGPPLLLLNGVFQTADSWKPLVKALAPHLTVIGADLPNQGRSPEAPQLGTVSAYADVVAEFIDGLGVEVSDLACFGFSFGADILLELRLNRGFEFPCLVAAAATPSGIDRYVDQYVDAQLALLRDHGVAAMAALTLQKIFAPGFYHEYPRMVPFLARHLQGLFGPRPQCLAALIGATRPNRLRASAVGAGCIELLVGREDLLYPAWLFEPHESGVAPTVVAGGHAFPIERPAETAALIRAALARSPVHGTGAATPTSMN